MSSFILKVNDDIPSKPKLQNMRRLRNIAQTIKGMVKED